MAVATEFVEVNPDALVTNYLRVNSNGWVG